jgi:hypothetical protein
MTSAAGGFRRSSMSRRISATTCAPFSKRWKAASSQLAYGAQAKLSARRVRALQKRLDALAHESERVSRAARVHGVRAKLAEQAAETAGKIWREHEARKDLAEIVERTLIKRDASQG